MTNVKLALDDLRCEHAKVAAEVQRVQQNLAALEDRKRRLFEAIESLEHLDEPAPEPEPEPDSAQLLLDERKDGRLVSPDSPIAKYIKRGGEGRRLSSTIMVADLLEELDKWVSRDELKDAFFDKFAREEIERFWDKPDNAFGNALNRALKDALIERGRRGCDHTEVYGSRAVHERLRQQTKRQEAASSDSDAEEEE